MTKGLFKRIIDRELPSYFVAEDHGHYAFLDINPLAEGHTLVVPKLEIDYIFDLPNDRLADLHIFAKKVALGLKKIIDCKRVGILVIGTEVPHAHIHLIPFQNENQMAITSMKLSIDSSRMQEISELARNTIIL